MEKRKKGRGGGGRGERVTFSVLEKADKRKLIDTNPIPFVPGGGNGGSVVLVGSYLNFSRQCR